MGRRIDRGNRRVAAAFRLTVWIYRQWWLYALTGCFLLFAAAGWSEPGSEVPLGMGVALLLVAAVLLCMRLSRKHVRPEQ